MAALGLVENALGHISVRDTDAEILVRRRSSRSPGCLPRLRTTSTRSSSTRARRRTDLGGWRVLNELPIHTEVRAGAARSRRSCTPNPGGGRVLAAGSPTDAYVWGVRYPGLRLAASVVPVWPRSALISTHELASAMADALGRRTGRDLRGHGLDTIGTGEPEDAVAPAVLVAHAIDTFARHTLTVLAAGSEPTPISDAIIASLPDLGDAFNVKVMLRHAFGRARWHRPEPTPPHRA